MADPPWIVVGGYCAHLANDWRTRANCGTAGFLMCDGVDRCWGEAVPLEGTRLCLACGFLGQRCCDDGACRESLDRARCIGGRCVPPDQAATTGPGPGSVPQDVLGSQWVIREDGRHITTLTLIDGAAGLFSGDFSGISKGTVTITVHGRRVTMHRMQDLLPADPPTLGRRICTYEGEFAPDFGTAEGTLNCNFFKHYRIRSDIPWTASISR